MLCVDPVSSKNVLIHLNHNPRMRISGFFFSLPLKEMTFNFPYYHKTSPEVVVLLKFVSFTHCCVMLENRNIEVKLIHSFEEFNSIIHLPNQPRIFLPYLNSFGNSLKMFRFSSYRIKE